MLGEHNGKSCSMSPMLVPVPAEPPTVDSVTCGEGERGLLPDGACEIGNASTTTLSAVSGAQTGLSTHWGEDYNQILVSQL